MSIPIDMAGRPGANIVLDIDANRLFGSGRTVRILSVTTRVLSRLAQDYGKTVSHADLIRAMCWAPTTRHNARDQVRYARHALAKLGVEDAIETEYAVGYRLLYPLDVVARLPMLLPQTRLGVLLPAIAAQKALPPQRLHA